MNCNECIYMTFSSSTGHEGKETEKLGFCHRYPPVLVDSSDDYDSKYESASWLHPTVDLLEGPSWCGEWSPIGQ